MSGAVVLELARADAEVVLAGALVLAGDDTGPALERAVWLAVAAQLTRQLRGAR